MTDAVIPVVVFYLLAALTVLGAAWVAFSTNIVRSAFGLFAALIGVAGLYASLSADLLTVVQLLVYVGGISVLVLFAVMLTSGIANVRASNAHGRMLGASVAAVGLLAVVVLAAGAFPNSAEAPAGPSTEAMGNALLGTYVLPFELVSMLLLAALLGGVTLARGWRRS
jgi:NADH:ubiquinone oxidoreductase subunit 6 (subunit J)